MIPRLLGLDLSLNGTGICMRVGENPEPFVTFLKGVPPVPGERVDFVHYPFVHAHVEGPYLLTRIPFEKGTKKNPAIASTPYEKFRIIVPAILKLARCMRPEDLILVEDYAFAAMGDARTKLAELGGIIKWELRNAGHDIKVVSPNTLKKFVGAAIGGGKELVLKEIYKRWGIDLVDNNEADAFVLCKIAEAMSGELDLAKYQREVIEKVRVA